MKRTYLLFLAAFISFAPGLYGQDYISLDSLDSYFGELVDNWQMPGMAIAIVKDGEVVFAHAYGVKVAGEVTEIDPSTNFAIASLSKAFTSASIAILVDEGKLDWEDKVIDYLPWFRLEDPYVTANLTIRDLLCHRAGYKTFGGDLLWFETTYDRDEVLRRARYMEPVYGFREQFGYSNIMYIAAGQVIQAVSGQSWEDFVTSHFIRPLGMDRTVTSVSQLDTKGNYAMPHSVKPDGVLPVPYMQWDNVAAAGGINSNVIDMSKWIELLLGRGVLGEDTFFSPSLTRELWSVQTPLSVSPGSQQLWPSTHFAGYGLGWKLEDYRGNKVIGHSGGTDGMTSYLALVPEQNFGFIILTNAYSSMYYPVQYMILDAFLGTDGKDWGAMFLEYSKRRQGWEAKRLKEEEEARVKKTKPSLDLKEYVGTYGGDLYGNAKVSLEKGILVLRFDPAPGLTSDLSHWHYDTFNLEFRDLKSLPDGKVNFIIGPDGKVNEMRIDVPNPDFDFTELEFKRIDE